jgi:TRL-like protein family
MKKFALPVVCAAIVASMSGCVTVSGGNGAAVGVLYSGYKMGGAVGSGTGTKTGEACAMSILGVVAIGDASISSAKSAGGITQVAHVDHDIFNVLGIYGKTCTIVVGQ